MVVNMKALNLTVIRLELLKQEGQLERERKEWWMNENITFLQNEREPAEERWEGEVGWGGIEWPQRKQISRPWRGLPAMIVPLREQSQSEPMQTQTHTHNENIKVISCPTCLSNANKHIPVRIHRVDLRVMLVFTLYDFLHQTFTHLLEDFCSGCKYYTLMITISFPLFPVILITLHSTFF